MARIPDYELCVEFIELLQKYVTAADKCCDSLEDCADDYFDVLVGISEPDTQSLLQLEEIVSNVHRIKDRLNSLIWTAQMINEEMCGEVMDED